MSKRKSSENRPSRPDRGDRQISDQDAPAAPSHTSAAAIRETVESIVIAFVLAFLFRTFEAEAFVIPTGSMAPTLMGKHKDLACPKCGYPYQVSASDSEQDGGKSREARVVSGTCPMCGFTANLTEDNPSHTGYASYSGDRILVGKFPYTFEQPKRWDVTVFKYPGDATVNYIKRLVGLPGETIRIKDGDLWIQRADGAFEIARKPPAKILAMLQPVFDNDLAPKIQSLGLPPRWQATSPSGKASDQWTTDDGASFAGAAGGAETWLRYRHLVPSYDQWLALLKFKSLRPQDEPPPQLIGDFTAYDTGVDLLKRLVPARFEDSSSAVGAPPDPGQLGIHWVGDLALQCQIGVQSDAGEIVLELVKGGRRFQCRFDLGAGTATLSINGLADFHPAANVKLQKGRQYQVIFSNIDAELRIWVDGKVVDFYAPTTYDPVALEVRMPAPADLSPAGIAVKNAEAKLSHLKLFRDIYYIADDKGGVPFNGRHNPYASQESHLTDFRGVWPDLADPATWELGFSEANMNEVVKALAPPDPKHPEKDQFFVLGDNSAQSKDGRLWGREYWVNREMLIGKALLIYWPHSWGQFPGALNLLPGWPNFRRMHLVR